MRKVVNFSFFAVPLAAAGFFLGRICLQSTRVFDLAMNSPQELIGMAIIFFIALGIFLVCAGLAVVLIRPFFAGILCFGFSAFALLFAWGFTLANLLFACIYCLLAVFYYFDSIEEIEQRIHFSIKPLIDKQNVLLAGLLIILAVNVFRGADTYLRTNDFHMPKHLVGAVSNQVIKNIETQLPADAKAQSQQSLTEELSANVNKVVDEQLKPFKQYIPVLFALGVFFMVSTLARFLLWFPMLIVKLLLSTLILAGLIKVVTRQVDVQRLTMD